MVTQRRPPPLYCTLVERKQKGKYCSVIVITVNDVLRYDSNPSTTSESSDESDSGSGSGSGDERRRKAKEQKKQEKKEKRKKSKTIVRYY